MLVAQTVVSECGPLKGTTKAQEHTFVILTSIRGDGRERQLSSWERLGTAFNKNSLKWGGNQGVTFQIVL